MANGERTEHHPNRRVDRAQCAARSLEDSGNIPSQRIPRPTSADDSSYQTPEGTDGHYGDNFQPKRKGTGNILVDPIGNQWSNSTDPKDWL